MADDIKIKIAADGATQAAAGVDKLVGALEKQRKTQEMIRQTSEQIKRQNVIDDLKKQTAEVNNLSTTLQRWNQSLASAGGSGGGAAGAIGNVANSTQKLRAQLGPTLGLLGGLGGQFATLVPQTGSVVTSLGVAGGAFSKVLALLGGGPGIIVGGLIAGVGALATYFAEAKKEADELAKATEANAKAMGSYLDQLQKLRSEVSSTRSQIKAEGDLQNRLRSGRGTSEEYGTEIDLLQKRLSNRYYSDETLKGLLQSGNRDEWDKRQMARARLQRQRDQFTGFQSAAEEQEAAARQQAFDKRTLELELAANPEKEKGDGKNPYGPGWGPSQELLEKLRKMQVENTNRIAEEELRIQNDKRQQEATAFADKNDREMKAMKTRWDVEDQRRVEEEAQENIAHAKKMKLREEEIQMQRNVATQGTQILAGASIKALQIISKGQKAQIGMILEGIGDQAVALGTITLFDGIAKSISLDARGPGLIATGSAEIAFGLGLGAAGARAPGGSAAGGGGGMNTGSNPFSPRDMHAASPVNQNQGPTMININMPTVVSPTAEDGRRIQEALDAKARVYG